MFLNSMFLSGGYDAIYVFYNHFTTPVTVHVDVLQITTIKKRSKNLESVGAFLQCLFPPDQPEVQFPHQLSVRYLTVSNCSNGRRFDMSRGALSGEETVKVFDNNFQYPKSFVTTYFETDMQDRKRKFEEEPTETNYFKTFGRFTSYKFVEVGNKHLHLHVVDKHGKSQIFQLVPVADNSVLSENADASSCEITPVGI
jgi:hypothetical protein